MYQLSPIFEPVTNFQLNVWKQLKSINLWGSFYSPMMNCEILLGCSENYLICCQKISIHCQYFFCSLEFDLKFQLLRTQPLNDRSIGIAYGIRFEKDNNYESVQFNSPHPENVEQWGLILGKKINQRNFHQLFRAKKKIGKGAFATVYLAQRLLDNKLVAVKAFSKEKQYSGDKGKQSLQNQIKIMRKINHENLMKLQGVYETENSIYVILEYLQGVQLNEKLKNKTQYTLNESLIIIKQILKALKHLSDKRIIHRDIKPQNIMFKDPNTLELGICDFGLATEADEQNYLFVRCGTPGFVAPQIINIKDMKTKSQPISDVFSAGIIFHYLLFGFSIFPGNKYNQILAQNRNCLFSFQELHYKSLPPLILDLLQKMLQKNPKERISAHSALKHKALNNEEMVEESSEGKTYILSGIMNLIQKKNKSENIKK